MGLCATVGELLDSLLQIEQNSVIRLEATVVLSPLQNVRPKNICAALFEKKVENVCKVVYERDSTTVAEKGHHLFRSQIISFELTAVM